MSARYAITLYVHVLCAMSVSYWKEVFVVILLHNNSLNLNYCALKSYVPFYIFLFSNIFLYSSTVYRNNNLCREVTVEFFFRRTSSLDQLSTLIILK